MIRRNPYARDLASRKYRQQTVPAKRPEDARPGCDSCGAVDGYVAVAGTVQCRACGAEVEPHSFW